ncbi:MAG: diguanylate cyclase [Pirellulaceae bacterium]|nr:diguanylate cyclase [Pirellulaceae bacterium]
MSHSLPKVLLVDDDTAMLRLLAKWLEAGGFDVRRAADGYQAMAMIEADCPAILVTDWEMPQFDGLDLCRWVRAQNLPNYVYTIFLTVRCGSQDIVRGLEAGADDFVKKPIDRDELLARMRSGTRVMELERRLCTAANTDTLTSLANRRTLFDQFSREWPRSVRHHVPLSCVMLDIDFFKKINDTYGHPVGDEVIRQVGAALTAGVRSSDTPARYGGEEFCVLMPETTEEQAVQWAERMRLRLGILRIATGEKELTISASFGVAQRLPDTASAEQLIDWADQALVVAKRSGRDRVVPYTALNQKLQLENTENDPAAILRGVPARTVMTTLVAPLRQDDTVGSASNYFLRFRINSAPVVDATGQLVGVLSEKDVMAIMLGRDWWSTKIKDVMKKNVVCYEEETPALAVYEFLCRVTIRGAVIVKQGRPTGVITRSSLLRYFMNALAVNRVGGVTHDLDAAEAALSSFAHADCPRKRISQTVRALADEISDLNQRMAGDSDDLIPCVVGGGSRIQELVNDLLAISRYANELRDRAGDDDRDPSPFGDPAPMQQGAAALLAAMQLAEQG